MAFSLRKPSERSTVGLDIDGRYMAAAQVVGARVVRGASLDLPEGLVREGEVTDPRRARRPAQELRLPGRPAAQRAPRRVKPADRRARDRTAAHRGREAARRRRSLPGLRGDCHAPGRGRARPPGRRLLQCARRHSADAGCPGGGSPQDDRHVAPGGQGSAGLKPEGVDLDAFALVRTLAGGSNESEERGASLLPLAGVTNLAIALGSTCFFTRPLSAVWDDGDAGFAACRRDPAVDRLLHDPAAGQSPSAKWCCPGPGSADTGLVDNLERPSRNPRPRRGSARRRGRVRARAGRGSPPLHRGRGPIHGSGGVRPVNLLPQDQRRRQPSQSHRQGRLRADRRARGCCWRWSPSTCSARTTSTDRENQAAAAKAEAI